MDERRTDLRRRVLKAARIVINDGKSTVSCTLRNLSPTGALLQVEAAFRMPDEFELAMQDGTRRSCKVVRRSTTELGVLFR